MDTPPYKVCFQSNEVLPTGKVVITTECCGSNQAPIVVEGGVIVITRSNYYVLNLTFKVSQRSFTRMSLALYKISHKNKTKTKIAETVAWPCHEYNLVFEGVLEVGTVLGLRIQDDSCIDSFALSGCIDRDQARYNQIIQLSNTTLFDKNRHVQFITNRPDNLPPPAPEFPPQYPADTPFIPWTAITTPWREGQTTPAGQTSAPGYPNANWYDKFQSVQYSVFFFLGIDMFTIEPDSPELTIFMKNFEDRGYQNELKMIYMSALTSNIMPKYSEKLDTMLNEVRTRITICHEPAISSFKDSLIKMFLSMHVGVDDYPDYVVTYFELFLDVIGFGDPNRSGRNEAMIFGNTNSPRVKEYFARRNTIIVESGDDTTLLYYWNKAGLPVESLLIEAVHNGVAFLQYANLFYKLIADKLWSLTGPNDPYTLYGLPSVDLPFWYPRSPIPLKATVPIVGTVGPVDFFKKMQDASTAEEELDIIREAYRIFAPNANSFSNLQPSMGCPFKQTAGPQCRHVWQQIMIYNQQVPDALKVPSYFKYDLSKYANFQAVFDVPPPPPVDPLDVFNPRDLFTISPTDNDNQYGDGTVLQANNPNIIPVFSDPTYLYAGMSYRRCAGEILNAFYGIKMLKVFADVVWTVSPVDSPPDYSKYKTLAPFTAVPDNITGRAA